MPTSTPDGDLHEPSFEELYEDAPCGYLSWRPDGTIVRANRTLLRSLGRTGGELVGRRLQDLLAPGSRIYQATHWGPLLELQGRVAEIPVDLLRADGSRLPALLNASLTRESGGAPAVIRASLFDATDRRRYERQLVGRAEQQAAVARLGHRALEGLALEELFGEAADEVRQHVAASVDFLRPGSPRPEGEGETTFAVPVGPPSEPFGELVLRARDGEGFAPGDTSFAKSVANVLGTAIERRRIDDAARHRARHDALTGLPNRVSLVERLATLVAEAEAADTTFPLCVADLDGFKLVNDTRGHAAGDELLRAVGERLAGALGDELVVGRLSGDEFVVLPAAVPAELAADELAARVLQILRAPFGIEGVEHVLTASAGVVEAGAGSDPDGVLRDADVAMYRAKDLGRARAVRFEASMRRRSEERVRIESELRTALREGQLRVFYQPVVCATTGGVASMEALVRWEHPERGLVPPGMFVPVAEDSGLVVDLGRFVLEEACRQLVAWRAAGVASDDLGVAVNVSARQLALPGFPAVVAEVLRDTGLDPARLSLEITETILMSDESHREVLDALAALGVGLSLDDFGTGASALARLKRFPVDTLKIDRAFVMGLGAEDGADDAIVAAVLALAAALSLKVVAEGVETEEQLRALKRMGCERIQGYLFSKPVPGAEMQALLERAPFAVGPALAVAA